MHLPSELKKAPAAETSTVEVKKMRKETVVVSIKKSTGELKFETHGVKGKACLKMLEELLGELVDVTDCELTDEYYDDDDSHVSEEVDDVVNIGGEDNE
jgi:hypothetical protein